ncbi:MAG TPA: hypothetical protein VMV24_01260 [Candidatus Dormibacteraeota bacterium]|nr:hypothetical protein [Candidatus Dormibacteraeota bacterium]
MLEKLHTDPNDRPSLFEPPINEPLILDEDRMNKEPALETSQNIVGGEGDQFKLLRELYNFSSIHFIPTEASLIANPEDFLERVEVIQNLAFDYNEILTLEQKATALKTIADIGLEIENITNQQRAINAKNSKIKHKEDFVDSRKHMIRDLMVQRKQIYDNLGFGRMVELGIITQENLIELYEADLIVLFQCLRGESQNKAHAIDRNRLNRYKQAINEYVSLKEIF